MTIPAFQTVLKILAGAGPVPAARFVWGTPAAPFSVGSRGDWVVQAPGVEPVHFFLAFDGRLIQASGLPSGPRVLLNGVPVEQNWTPVPVSSELTFGNARVSVLCEELVPESPAVPAAHCETKFIPDQAAAQLAPKFMPNQPAPAPAPAMGFGSNRTVALPNLQVGSWPPKDMGAPPPAVRPEPQQPALLGFAPVPHVSRLLSPQQDAGAPVWPPPDLAQPAASAKTQESERIRLPVTADQAPVASPEPGKAYETVSDAGALRQQLPDRGSGAPRPVGSSGSVQASDATRAGAPIATRLSTDSPEPRSVPGSVGVFGGSSPPQYAAPAAGGIAYAPPGGFAPPAPGGFASPAPGGFASPAPGGFAPPAPGGFAQQGPVVQPAGTTNVPPLLKAWKATSWPKRALLIALPFAAYFGLFYEPAAQPEAPAPQSKSQASTAAAADTAAAPAVAATAPVAAVTAVPATTSVQEALPPAVQTATAAPTAAPPSGPAAAVTAASAETAPKAETPASKKQQASASGDEDAGSPAERDALNAAFQGKLAEAADRYQQLASGADAQKFSLAARFIREQAVRKP